MAQNHENDETQLFKFKSQLKVVSINDIERNPNNPRELQGREDVQDLKKSIRLIGVLVPLLVTPKPGVEDKYILVEGERRWRACRQLFDETNEKRFLSVPVNILQTPPSDFENLMTMFNVHSHRKKWGRAAEAEAIGRLREIENRKMSNTGKISNLTGLREILVEEDLTYLKFPEDIRKLAYEGELGVYNLILLGRNLKALEEIFPGFSERYRWGEVSRTLIDKVRSHTIPRSRDFNSLSFLARACLQYKNDAVFFDAFNRLISDPNYGIGDMTAFVDRELGYKVTETFKRRCIDFLESLTAHASYRNYKVDKSVFEVLTRMKQTIAKIILE
jgi:ParB/RepB/Spo0J family partition protein